MQATIPELLQAEVVQFRGRAWLPAQILDWWDKRSEPLLLISGGPGTGKSMVAAWLAGYGPQPEQAAAQTDLQRLRDLIKGAHFCNAIDTWNNSPKGMADSLARQLTANLPEFSDALLTQVGSNLQLNSEPKVVNNFGSVTGVVIKSLDLGGLLDEPSFLVALLNPLVEYFKQPGRQPLLLLVDALDEAALYEGKYKILRAVLALANLQAPVRLIATVRDPEALPEGYREAYRRDLILDAPPDQNDVTDYINARMQASQYPALPGLIPEVIKRARGNFLYAALVVSDLLERAKSGEQLSLDDVPDELAGHYRRFLERLTDDDLDVWRKQLRPVLGVVAVAQDPYLRLKPLGLVTRRNRTALVDALQQCRSYLSGRLDPQDEDSGPFTLFHKSFADFLLDSTNNKDYYIDPADAHANLAYYYWPSGDASPAYRNWDDYGLRNVPTHLAGATETFDDDERHTLTGRLVQLVVSPGYQQNLVERVKDFSQFDLSLEKALKTACQDLEPEALALVIRAAHKLFAFRESTRRSRIVFQQAAQGNLAAARANLASFPIDADWRAAAELLIAWLLAGDPALQPVARTLADEVRTNYSGKYPLDLMADRVAESWLPGQIHQPPPLPTPPPWEILEAVVYKLRSEKIQAGLLDSYIDHVHNQLSETMPVLEEFDIQPGPDGAPVQRASIDGPVLVAYIREHPDSMSGCRAFLEYLNIMAANQYRQYRNLALWKLMDAVLRHPDPAWARAALVRVVSAALAPGGAPFTEAFGTVLLAQQARLGHQPAADTLKLRYDEALRRASSLSEERGHNDITGANKRRHTALALAYNLLPGEEQRVHDLLTWGYHLPRGYAGFMTSAWMNLAESLSILGLPLDQIQPSLDEAMESARHIEDNTFRSRMILFVNSLREDWWGLPPAAADLAAIIKDFSERPFSARFTPFYRLGQSFNLPAPSQEAKDLAYELQQAQTLRQIASSLGYNPLAMLEVNAGLGGSIDSQLAPGVSVVRLPDPDFAPWLAAHLSATVAASPIFDPRKKQELIQRLVPVAVLDRTTLDTVLARLIYAAQPDSLDILRACEQDQDRPLAG